MGVECCFLTDRQPTAAPRPSPPPFFPIFLRCLVDTDTVVLTQKVAILLLTPLQPPPPEATVSG
jgi:hypothetical protein